MPIIASILCMLHASTGPIYVKGELHTTLLFAMAFKGEPVSYADLDTLADVLVKTHANDKLFQQLFLKVPHEVQVAWYADAFRKT